MMVATNGDDILATVFDGEILGGLGGNDTLTSGFNKTTLFGGPGEDSLTTKFAATDAQTLRSSAIQFGGRGRDHLIAEIGASAYGGSARIEQYGGGDDDFIEARAYVTEFINLDSDGLFIEVHGGTGCDIIDVLADFSPGADGVGTNLVYGDSGNDKITANAYSFFSGFSSTLSNIIDGGAGDDEIEARLSGSSNSGDVLHNALTGGYGNDILKAYSYTNSNVSVPSVRHELNGGAGNDHLESIYVSTGQDSSANVFAELEGGTGDDYLLASSDFPSWEFGGPNIAHNLYGGAGNDSLNSVISSRALSNLRTHMFGGAGGDALDASVDITDNSFGYGATGAVTNNLQGEDGNDTLAASISYFSDYTEADLNLFNELFGGSGNDILEAELEVLIADSFSDWSATYAVGSNTLYGGAGNDVLTARIDAHNDAELIDLTASSFLYGEEGNDSITVVGGTANLLDGGVGNDVLVGSDGQDTLVGGAGADTLTGGLGSDFFVFDILEARPSKDIITDFVSGADEIHISATAYASLAGYGPGALNEGELAYGASATTSDQHLIYNSANGALYYDEDGKGGDAQVLIAVLSGAPSLHASDIVLT